MTPETGLGFAHFFAQSDAVAKTLLAILVVMSIASWAIIAIRIARSVFATASLWPMKWAKPRPFPSEVTVTSPIRIRGE